jgi:hypothetical protein
VEHRRHHAEIDVPVRSVATWSGAAIVGAALAWWAHPVVALGWLAGHGAYDTVHRSIHARAPRGRYGRLVRRQHLDHHFGGAGRNFGVTSPVWDVVLGTYRRPATVRLPLDTAPPWLVAASVVGHPDPGRLGPPGGPGRRDGPGRTAAPPWAADYELVARRPGTAPPADDGASDPGPSPVGRSAGDGRRATGHG